MAAESNTIRELFGQYYEKFAGPVDFVTYFTVGKPKLDESDAGDVVIRELKQSIAYIHADVMWLIQHEDAAINVQTSNDSLVQFANTARFIGSGQGIFQALTTVDATEKQQMATIYQDWVDCLRALNTFITTVQRTRPELYSINQAIQLARDRDTLFSLENMD